MRKLLTVFLSALLIFALCGCGQTTILAYQSRAGHYQIRYAGESGEVACELTLAEGDDTRDFVLSFGEGAHTPAYLLGRTAETYWAEYAGARVTIAPPQIAVDILHLFSIPAKAQVLDVKKEGGTRVVTLRADEILYTLHFEGAELVPSYISAENGRFYSIFVK